MFTWIDDNQPILWSLGAASIALFIASLIVIPALVVRIRPDYFIHDKRPPRRWVNSSPMVRTFIVVGKNVLGIVLMIAGVAMLALPGQGLLTILVGFLLVDFPGKYRVEQWLVSRRVISRPINWLRHRAGRLPMQIPEAQHQ
jgi:hypothetical protein